MDFKRITILISAILLLSGAGNLQTDCAGKSSGFIPLADLETNIFSGFIGGKYENGSNKIPRSHFDEGIKLSNEIIPLNSDGIVDSNNGKIGFLVLGYSTAAMTGRTFKSICTTQPVDPHLEILIGAQGGRDINSMTEINSTYWTVVDSVLFSKSMNNNQVQIIWISSGDIYAWQLPFPEHSQSQTEKYRSMLANCYHLYPNLKLVFISDRPYAGYIGPENGGPKELAEPTGYYNSWTVKWIIGKQINGEKGFTENEIPFIDWGPMLWTDGSNGNRKGYTWECDDAGHGGIHPSSKGRMKEAALLFIYFSNHPYTNSIFN